MVFVHLLELNILNVLDLGTRKFPALRLSAPGALKTAEA
jgi:hypothetical protein